MRLVLFLGIFLSQPLVAASPPSMRSHVRDYVENFVRDSEQAKDPESIRSFNMEQKSLAENLTHFLLQMDAAEFNDLIVAEMENYFHNANERPAIRTLLDTVGVEMNPELLERRLESLPGNIIEGAILGASLIALARSSIALGRAGVFKVFAGRMSQWAKRSVNPRSGTSLTTPWAEPPAPGRITAWVGGLSPGVQMSMGVGIGAVGGGVKYWAAQNSVVKADPRPALRVLDLWIAFEHYALVACALRTEAEALGEDGNSNARREALRARFSLVEREFRSFRALVPELEEPTPAPERTPGRGASAVVASDLNLEACRAGASTVALSPIANDLARAARALRSASEATELPPSRQP